MKSYKVFLTKSSIAARVIFNGLHAEGNNNTGYGYADGQDMVPSIYYGKGYFYAYAEVDTKEEKPATFEIVVC